MLFGVTFIDGGFRPAIAKEGIKWNQIVVRDGSRIVVRKVRSSERLNFRPITGYTQEKLAKAFLRRTSLGTKVTITKGAKNILLEATS
jgi:hypothetical protein